MNNFSEGLNLSLPLLRPVSHCRTASAAQGLPEMPCHMDQEARALPKQEHWLGGTAAGVWQRPAAAWMCPSSQVGHNLAAIIKPTRVAH